MAHSEAETRAVIEALVKTVKNRLYLEVDGEIIDIELFEGVQNLIESLDNSIKERDNEIENLSKEVQDLETEREVGRF